MVRTIPNQKNNKKLDGHQLFPFWLLEFQMAFEYQLTEPFIIGMTFNLPKSKHVRCPDPTADEF